MIKSDWTEECSFRSGSGVPAKIQIIDQPGEKRRDKVLPTEKRSQGSKTNLGCLQGRKTCGWSMVNADRSEMKSEK